MPAGVVENVIISFNFFLTYWERPFEESSSAVIVVEHEGLLVARDNDNIGLHHPNLIQCFTGACMEEVSSITAKSA